MIKAIIIDDEPLAANIVQEFLKEFPQIEVVEVCRDGFQGLKAIQEHEPDLLFLDVQMPKITGFEMLELLDEPPAVIFTTAYDEYALQAFDAMAVDYLLKPFSQSRFNQSIEKYLAFAGESNTVSSSKLNELVEKSKRLVVRVKNEVKIIPTHEVRYFQAEDDYVSIHTANGVYLKKMTMKSLEEALDPMKFSRIHRSYLININEITNIEPYERDTYLVKLRGEEKVPVSKTGYAKLRKVLGI